MEEAETLQRTHVTILFKLRKISRDANFLKNLRKKMQVAAERKSYITQHKSQETEQG